MPPFKDNTVHLCDHCGERGTGKYCKTCGSAAGRRTIDEANIKIMKENLAKGFSYNHPYWARLRSIAKV
jgi:hypothetical protein